jgi:capsular polysaccharide biosynthesis protein
MTCTGGGHHEGQGWDVVTIAVPTRVTRPDTTVADPTREPTNVPSRRLFGPGWPLATLFVPFPLWWALGLSEWIVPMMVVPMALHLLRQRRVLVPRGFGWWLTFLLWVLVGVVLLKVDAFGAVADNSSTRLITFGYRLAWYLSITVVLMYVVNTRAQLSVTRISRILAWMFVTVTLGGLLGVLSPYFEFRSLMELVLPHSLAGNQFIQKMIHPQAAELQKVLGFVSPRPSAPFAYTNTWGLNFAVTLPFFLYAWCGRDAGWRRLAAGPVLLVAAVPMIYSINRGMWGALVAMALFVAIRAAVTGKPALLWGVIAGTAAIAVVLSLSPLGGIVTSRFANKGSEQGRTNLGTLTVQSVTATSPIVGLGSTRNVQGNFQSITGGSTAQCPRCSPPALGTQGQLWLVVYSQGLVGLALFAVFFALMFLRHIRLRSPAATIGLSVLVAWAVTLPVYNSLGLGLLIVMLAVGLLCREAAAEVSDAPGTLSTRLPVVPLSRYIAVIRDELPLVLVVALLGLALGATWTVLRPSPYKATTTVMLTAPPRYPTTTQRPKDVNTDAQLVAGQAVQRATADASGRSLADVAEHLTVTATPNTTVLHLHFTAPGAKAATAGVRAAATTFLHQRTLRLQAEQRSQQTVLRAQADSLAAATGILDREVSSIKARVSDRSVARAQTVVTRDRRSQLLTRATEVARQSARIDAMTLTGGRVTGSTEATRSGDPARVALVSGLTAGLGLGLLLAMVRGAAGPRLLRLKELNREVGLPLVGRVPYTPDGVRSLLLMLRRQPIAYVAVDDRDPTASGMARTLEEAAPRHESRVGAVVVASERSRTDEVVACRDQLLQQQIEVHGLVVATRLRPRRTSMSG